MLVFLEASGSYRVNQKFQILRALQIIFAMTSISGCTSVAVHQPDMSDVDKEHIKLHYCITSSAEMNLVDKTLESKQNKIQFDGAVLLAIEDLRKGLSTQLIRQTQWEPVLTQDCKNVITDETGSLDLLLTIELSGYGSLKPRWKKILIGTGAVEALAQGLIVSGATHNPWLGAGVAAEEMTSEYLTWNGVDWLLGESFAPVTLEGELKNINNNQVIWHDSYFVTENEKELEGLDEHEKKDKSRQLSASLHKAQTELISDLNGYMSQEIYR